MRYIHKKKRNGKKEMTVLWSQISNICSGS